MHRFFYKVYHFFISLKLAVGTLSTLACLTAVGTLIESRHTQELANKVIYHSWLMNLTLFLLAINLFFVLVDRWPWKKRQVGFVVAHIGILIVISGSFITRHLGIDAILQFAEGESKSFIQLPAKEIKIYSSYDGSKFTLLHQTEADFFFDRPSESKPFPIHAAGQQFDVISYIPYGIPREHYQKNKQAQGVALRYYLQGQMGQFVDWIYLDSQKTTTTQSLGPAFITLTKDKNHKPTKQRELVLEVNQNQNQIFYFSQKQNKKTQIQIGEEFKTPWMDFKFRLIEFLPQAQRKILFSPQKKVSDFTLEALKVRYGKHQEWVGENSYIRFYTKDRVYAFGYVNKSLFLGFNLKLIDFRMTKYQGSEKAKTYESEVELEGKRHIISMNEPLKHKGYVFYQSSFQEEEGQPTRSILSVNKDPGRFFKYIGSFLIIMGIMLLFYKRKMGKQVL